MSHLSNGLRLLYEAAQLELSARRRSARNTGIRLSAAAVLGCFTAVWGEAVLFLAVRPAFEPWQAALCLFAFNGLLLVLVAILGTRQRRLAARFEQEGRARKESGTQELRLAREEFFERSDRALENAGRIAAPGLRPPDTLDRMVLASGIAFAAGLAVARATRRH